MPTLYLVLPRAVLCTRYILPPLWVNIFHDVLKSKLTIKIKPSNLQNFTQMRTHFAQLYMAGNFPYLTDVVRISGREWGPTCPSHHLNLFPLNRLYTKLAKSQTVRIHLSNLTCSFCFPCKSLHML